MTALAEFTFLVHGLCMGKYTHHLTVDEII